MLGLFQATGGVSAVTQDANLEDAKAPTQQGPVRRLPQPIQYRTLSGDYADGILIGWRKDRLRGWQAVVVVELAAADVRPPRDGAAAHRPSSHPLHRRKRWTIG